MPEIIKLRKVLIHTREDGETHHVRTVNGHRVEETLCGKRLHAISTVYTPRLQVICGQCCEEAEALSFNLKGEVI